jgi:hypothetical protein
VSNATLFVRFKDSKRAEDRGFKSEHSFPVYQIRDIEEDDDLVTELLLANNEGNLLWIPMGDFKRSKPESGGGGGRDQRRPRPQRPQRDNRGEDRDNRGNRKSETPTPGGQPGTIMGGRNFDD